jgi:hypothetical protein
MNQKWVNSAKDGENVDEAIKKNFKSLLPTPMEIDLYLKSFFARNVMEEEIKQSALSEFGNPGPGGNGGGQAQGQGGFIPQDQNGNISNSSDDFFQQLKDLKL